MNKLRLIVFIMLATVFSAQSRPSVFHFNSLGFFPDKPKSASISEKFETFSIVDIKNGETVFTGNASGPYTQDGFEITVWIADFSELSREGEYQIKLDNGKVSHAFPIGSDIYNFAFETAMRGFYLWRCGTAVRGEFNGNIYETGACHLNDGYLDYLGQPGVRKDGTGGWHDAGDYGKYTVNASITVGVMFYAWEHFHKKLKSFDLGLPETAPGFPQYLKEMKWETDWLLKMQYPDGSGRVSHKLTRINFSGMIMPQYDDEKRYFTECSSAATAGFVGMMAQAARFFKPYDEAYAQKCLDAAILSYNYLAENPENKRFVQGDFQTGGYQTDDEDDRLWAAAEMWETTGDKKYLNDFETRLKAMDTKVDENWDWGNVRNQGTFTYLLSEREGRDPELLEKVKKEVIKVADQIVEKAENDIFNRPLGNTYYWGCNGTVARQAVNLQIANMIQPNEKYINTALDAAAHIFGRNYYARSFVTGLGFEPPLLPHDRRSSADGIVDPWPGYIVGGGTQATNWVDVEESYTTNEIAMNWQGALVYILAGFIK